MNHKKETLREEIERRRREIDELSRKDRGGLRESETYYQRGITKIQPPEPWPDPPEEEEEENNKDKN
uniref:Uncharacterized protein n=1 Tax=Candidatus Kentrum sp. MB TaxID=2138164 RepID=A0A450X0R0_9GAMM|nr:MAG: hypothetical protein BECKMB1821G_GA0114241_100330 [Candidatus Kentron sp. MB]VFK26500.1 MAG: hypothetical protein BECKMB1821I_GA0114274_100117 [Candidatus Kentron sp. MB]VFK74566.1 MAG: hypothetical protein BECKMB1821H_GA0114242_100657 [Candidatus Kentron sp. MB]